MSRAWPSVQFRMPDEERQALLAGITAMNIQPQEFYRRILLAAVGRKDLADQVESDRPNIRALGLAAVAATKAAAKVAPLAKKRALAPLKRRNAVTAKRAGKRAK